MGDYLTMALEPTADEMSNHDMEVLVRLSVLTKGKALSQRREMRRDLVLACLASCSYGMPLEASEIRTRIEELTRCRMADADISAILDDLAREGIVDHVSGLKYKTVKPVRAPDFRELTEPIWKDFQAFVLSHDKDYDPYLNVDARPILDSVLLRLLAKVAVSNIGSESSIETLPIDNFRTEISTMVKTTNLPEKYGNLTFDFLHSGPESLKKLVYDSYSGFIKMDLLLREQEIGGLDFIDTIGYLLLDTSFFTALLCRTDPSYPISRAVAAQCRNHNIPMHFAHETRSELNGFIMGSSRELAGLSISSGHSVIRSQFVTDFLKQEEEDSNEYITRIQNWEEALLKEYGICRLPGPLEVEPDRAPYDYVKKMLPIVEKIRNLDRGRRDIRYVPRLRMAQQVEHDAYCLGLVSALREMNEGDAIKKLGPWFLTFDNLVTGVDEMNSPGPGVGRLAIQPRTLLDYFITFSKLGFRKEDRDTVAEAIIKYTARSLQQTITLDEYSKLVTAKLGLRSGDVDVVRRILMAAPLRSELQKALEYNDGTEAEKIVYETFSSPDFVEHIAGTKELKIKLHELSLKLKQKENEIRQKDDIIAELAKRPAQVINVNVSTSLEVNFFAEINGIVGILESEKVFEKGLLSRPDLSSMQKAREWLRGAREFIATSEVVGNAVKGLLPVIARLIGP